jgi:glycosyltransferase 2 family protein
MRPQIKTLLILLVTIALVAWFLRQAHFSDVWSEIRHADPWALLLALAMGLSTYVLRAMRWQYLLRPIGNAGFGVAFRTTVIGFAANGMLPARVGEVLRPYLLARREGLSVPSTFATIILERLLDLLIVLLFFGLFLLVFDTGMGAHNGKLWETIKFWGLLAAGGALTALVMIAFLARRPADVGAGVERVARVLPERFATPIAHAAHRFVEGLAVMRSPLHVLGSLLFSIPVWLSIQATVWAVTLAFHMTIPFTGTFLMIILLTAGVAVPTPGAVGGYHEAFRLAATSFYGIPNDRAVGGAIVLHAITFIPVILLGAYFMFREGLDFAGIRRMSEEAREMESAS